MPGGQTVGPGGLVEESHLPTSPCTFVPWAFPRHRAGFLDRAPALLKGPGMHKFTGPGLEGSGKGGDKEGAGGGMGSGHRRQGLLAQEIRAS